MRRSALGLVVVGILSSATFGWWTGREQARMERVDARAELLAEISHNREAMNLCFENMKNQFTPGYRHTQVLPDPRDLTISSEQGEIFRTQAQLNLAVNGPSFFVLSREGEVLYSRDGRFELRDGTFNNGQGVLMGYKLDDDQKAVGSPVALEFVLDP